ncbi:MAG: helix-turn-helix transcriptional regulator [Kiritimatiellae bacterium]|nr:helix-turn-helix transcriptional regulator [Kiritimatiellia bacterium]
MSNLRFKIARLRRGLTQRELARRVGVSEATVTRIETGRFVPSGALRQALSEILAVAAYEIFDSTGR